MFISKDFIRDGDRVKSCIKQIGDTLVCTYPLSIIIPEYYNGTELASVEDTIRLIGIFGILVDEKYFAMSDACAIMTITPSIINTINIDGENYFSFQFEKGDTICPNINLAKISTLVYRIYKNFYSKGNIVWYLSYNDVLSLFTTASLHGGANLLVDPSILEMQASSIARSSKDLTVYYRHTDHKSPPEYVPMDSVAYGATNTAAKLLGNYFGEGLTSSLIIESKTSESIETALLT